MNKLEASVFITSWIFSTSYLHEWGLDIILSPLLGLAFIITL